MKKDIVYYKELFGRLTQNRNNGPAPHKPILLLSIIDFYEHGFFSDNHIVLSEELVLTFSSLWKCYVSSSHHRCRFTTPFFHLSGEPFWKLVAYPGYEKDVEDASKMYAKNRMFASVKWAEIDEELAMLFLCEETRNELKEFLIEAHFSNRKV